MRKRFVIILVVVLSVTMLLPGCRKPVQTSPQAPVPSTTSSPFGAATLIDAFSDAGLSPRVLPAAGESIFGPGADHPVLSIGARRVQLFVFDTEPLASKAAKAVSEDGTTIPQVSANGAVQGVAMVEWKGRPRFFRRGNVVVLFLDEGGTIDQPVVGEDARVIQVLEGAMGAQFAGFLWKPASMTTP